MVYGCFNSLQKYLYVKRSITRYLTQESHLPEGRGGGKEEEGERDLDDEGGEDTEPVHPLGLQIGSVP